MTTPKWLLTLTLKTSVSCPQRTSRSFFLSSQALFEMRKNLPLNRIKQMGVRLFSEKRPLGEALINFLPPQQRGAQDSSTFGVPSFMTTGSVVTFVIQNFATDTQENEACGRQMAASKLSLSMLATTSTVMTRH